MDPIAITDYIRKKIRQKLEDVQTLLMSGAVKDMEQYRLLMGEIQGLSFVEKEIMALLKNMEMIDE